MSQSAQSDTAGSFSCPACPLFCFIRFHLHPSSFYCIWYIRFGSRYLIMEHVKETLRYFALYDWFFKFLFHRVFSVQVVLLAMFNITLQWDFSFFNCLYLEMFAIVPLSCKNPSTWKDLIWALTEFLFIMLFIKRIVLVLYIFIKRTFYMVTLLSNVLLHQCCIIPLRSVLLIRFV